MGAGEGVEGASADPACAQLLCGDAQEPADIRASHGHAKDASLKDTYNRPPQVIPSGCIVARPVRCIAARPYKR